MKNFLIIIFFFSSNIAQAQIQFDRADSLRGSLSKCRNYDVFYYQLELKVFPDSKSIAGSNTIFFSLEDSLDSLQIDLYENLFIDSITWKLNYPINNYNVTLNIADYANIKDYYVTADQDTLQINYYVLPINKSKAEKHFRQVKEMLSCFEKYFGPYPFINDEYKLVEAPYWGMEHQSAIAYGNRYQNNEFGFDFIIVHESGHEYWGNSISSWDHGQMWIHESFTTYMEALLVECQQGYQSSLAYLESQKPLIKNEMAIEQPVGVNFNHWEDADMYYKGSWMLHTIRNIIDDDERWFNILRQLYETYKISIVNSSQIIEFINDRIDHDLEPVFEQYLQQKNPPILQYYWQRENEDWKLYFRWNNVVENFEMPVKFKINGQLQTIYPTSDWQSGKLKKKSNFSWATNLYYFIPEVLTEGEDEKQV